MRYDISKIVTWIIPIINKACVSYGFRHLIKNWLQSVVLLLFVNNSISTLTLLGHSLPICASNSDTGMVYSPFWTSSYNGIICIRCHEKFNQFFIKLNNLTMYL